MNQQNGTHVVAYPDVFFLHEKQASGLPDANIGRRNFKVGSILDIPATLQPDRN